jgi:hypothetical protein
MRMGLSRCHKCGCVNWNAFLVKPHCHDCGSPEIDWLEPTPQNIQEAEEWGTKRLERAFLANLRQWRRSSRMPLR